MLSCSPNKKTSDANGHDGDPIFFSTLLFSLYLSHFPVLEMSFIHLSICSDPCLSFSGLCPFDFLDLSIFAPRCFLVISSRSPHSRYLFSDCFVYSACSILLLLFLFCTLHLHYIFFALRFRIHCHLAAFFSPHLYHEVVSDLAAPFPPPFRHAFVSVLFRHVPSQQPFSMCRIVRGTKVCLIILLYLPSCHAC